MDNLLQKAQLTVGQAISWAGGPGLHRKLAEHVWKQTSEQADRQLSFKASDFSQWWADPEVQGKKKLILLMVAFY